jgi:hypothetical protein
MVFVRPIPEGYVTGLVRDYPYARVAHLYKGTHSEPGWPMCKKGWNRDEGASYSIWRGNEGTRGVCAVCIRRATKNLPPVPAYGPYIDDEAVS